METGLRIHVWPRKWNLSSIDAQCLQAVLHLQFAFPGRYSIVEDSNPDVSPSGQLPYLTHLHHSISPLPSILAYISTLDAASLPLSEPSVSAPLPNPAMDDHSASEQKHKAVAWRAYVDSHLGDLVTHSFFSLYPNYNTFIRPTLASFLPFPQNLYVPDRYRNIYRPRLEAAGLWDVGEDPADGIPAAKLTKVEEKEQSKENIKRAFGRERILEKARTTFTLLTTLVASDSFIYGERPCSLDITLASYILLLLHTPLPNPLLKTLLLESYPSLISHACLVHSRAFPTNSAVHPRIIAPDPISSFSLIGRGIARVINDSLQSGKELSGEEKSMRRWRWAWFTAAGLGIIVYAVGSGVVTFVGSQTPEDESEQGMFTDAGVEDVEGEAEEEETEE